MTTISVVPVAALTRSKLEDQITALFRQEISASELQKAGISESDFKSASQGDFQVTQKAGFAAEAVVITFATKVAYDIWKKLILPRLEAKFGGKPFISEKDHSKQ